MPLALLPVCTKSDIARTAVEHPAANAENTMTEHNPALRINLRTNASLRPVHPTSEKNHNRAPIITVHRTTPSKSLWGSPCCEEASTFLIAMRCDLKQW